MVVTLLIPTALRAFTDGQGKVSLEGETVGQLVAALAASYPDIHQHLYEENGSLRAFINLYVGETNIKTTGGLDTPVKSGDEVLLVPAIAGGAGELA
ncbi:MoaD/ThiS family protein [Pectobacterium betavasculorum]|uniref:Molybdenum cofactor biosynthesis protein MoaD n=1 Tax=Pectobacterium betavasculorum TaxID=55207 RepID=A0ABR4UZA2_9GAMM|nr:MoaD/ThiS family protein [Pectobacterium betavasculorum]KFX20102.1 molybdenum cofactor biosynthesis protein MoaD [Pectobacterium betavasculorum]